MPSTSEGEAMCCKRLVGHLQSKQAETGHVAATPAGSRVDGIEAYVRYHGLDAVELADLEQRVHRMRDEQDETPGRDNVHAA